MYDRLSQNWKGKQFLLVDTCNNLQCYLVIAVDVACLAASVLGMIAGLHSAFVFSLMTVYSRSAAAVGKKLAFDRFLEQTAGEQLRGLRSFRLSLYAFLVQCYFIIQRPLPRVLWQVATPILLFMGWNVYKDTQSIIKSAGKELLTTNDEKASISTVAVSTESESAKTENSPSQVEES